MNRRKASTILNVAIGICSILCLFLLHRIMEQGTQRYYISAAILLPLVAVLLYETVIWRKAEKRKGMRESPISTLVLLGEGDRPIRTWDLTGKVGLLIGKSSDRYEVDIDLSETDYHSYIDPEHALLNCHETGWWLQDASSRNGVSIMRNGKELPLGSHTPIKLERSDIIVVAQYTRIAVS